MASTPSRYISILQVHPRILQDLGLDNTQEVANSELFFRWIFEAQVDMRLPVQFGRRETEALVEDCQVDKPEDFVMLMDASIIDECNEVVRCVRLRYGNVSRKRLNSQIYDSLKYVMSYELDESPFSFILSENANGKKLRFEYKHYFLDEVGLPLVDNNYFQAILAYCRYKWIVRSRSAGLRLYSPSDEEQAKASYIQFKQRNRGQSITDELNQDLVNQIMARYWDKGYVNLNPYKVQEDNLTILRNYRTGATRGFKW